MRALRVLCGERAAERPDRDRAEPLPRRRGRRAAAALRGPARGLLWRVTRAPGGVPHRHARRARLRRSRVRRRLSFGVVAEPMMGSVAPIVMSVFVFAGVGPVRRHGRARLRRRRRHRDRDRRDAERALPADGRGRGAGAARGPAAPRARGPGGRRRLVGARRARRGRLRPRDSCSARRSRSTRAGCSGPSSASCSAARSATPRTLGLDAIFPAFFLGLLAAELSRPRRGRRRSLIGRRDRAGADPACCPPGLPVLLASSGGADRAVRR